MARSRDEVRRYSKELIQRIIGEIESGKLSRADAARQYGVNHGTLWSWIQLYGKMQKPRVVEVVMADQKDKIEELQKALAEAHLKNRAYEELIQIAKERYKIDLKKNMPLMSSNDSKRKVARSKK